MKGRKKEEKGRGKGKRKKKSDVGRTNKCVATIVRECENEGAEGAQGPQCCSSCSTQPQCRLGFWAMVVVNLFACGGQHNKLQVKIKARKGGAKSLYMQIWRAVRGEFGKGTRREGMENKKKGGTYQQVVCLLSFYIITKFK